MEDKLKDKDQSYRSVDPSDDKTTNMVDDGSTDKREEETDRLSEGERPDIHKGSVLGQVDPRMADAAEQIKVDHDRTDSLKGENKTDL